MEPLAHHSIDYDAMCVRIGSCTPGVDSFKLNADAFSLFLRGMTLENIRSAVERVGIKISEDTFGRNKSLRAKVGTKKTRETTLKVKDELQQLTRLRNSIAHGGPGGFELDFCKIRRMSSFVAAFSIAVGGSAGRENLIRNEVVALYRLRGILRWDFSLLVDLNVSAFFSGESSPCVSAQLRGSSTSISRCVTNRDFSPGSSVATGFCLSHSTLLFIRPYSGDHSKRWVK